MEKKKCSICKLLLDLSNFYKDIRKKDGHNYRCKICSNKEGKKIRKRKNIETNGLYKVFDSMKLRCCCKNSKYYHRYGGRGINICKEWLSDFEVFYRWCKDNGHVKGLQIDRINNDGNYEPSNCRFVTPAVNVQNSSTAKLNPEKVIKIRRLLAFKTQKEIASIYDISQANVSDIKNRKIWSNIQ